MKLQDMVTVTNPLSRKLTTSCNCSHWARTHFSRYSDPVSVTVEHKREGGLSTLHFAHGKLSAKYKLVVTVKEERCKTFQALLFRQHGSLYPLADIRLGSNELLWLRQISGKVWCWLLAGWIMGWGSLSSCQ